MCRQAIAIWLLLGSLSAWTVAQPREAIPLPATMPATDAREQEQAAIVRLLLERSRLLEDAKFQVPLRFWEDYLRAAGLGPAVAAPVPCIAEDGVYDLAIDANGQGTLTASIQVRVFDPSLCRQLPVLSSAASWDEITVNKKPAKLPLVAGWQVLGADGPGLYVITAKAPLKPTGRESFSWALPAAKTVRTLVNVSSDSAWQVTARNTPHRLVGSAEKGTHGQLAIGPVDSIQLDYARPQAPAEHPPRYEVRGDVAWNFDPAGQQIAARLEALIIGRSDSLELTLPAGADRVSITGPQVRQVQTADGRAQVYLRGQVSGRVQLNVDFELPAARGETLKLGDIGIRDGNWSGGCLVMTNTSGGSEILPGTLSGLSEIALPDIPSSALPILSGPPAMACRITGRQWEAQADVLNLGELALRDSIIDLGHYEMLVQPDGTVLCKAVYEVRNRTRQFLRVDLPAGANVLLAKVNEKSLPLSPLKDQADAYLLPLVRSKASIKGMTSFPVELVFAFRTAKLAATGTTDLPLPRVDLPIAYAWCESYLPEELLAKESTGGMANVRQYSSETATAQLAYGSGELAEGYKESSRPKALTGAAARPAPAKPAPDKRPFWAGEALFGINSGTAKSAQPSPSPAYSVLTASRPAGKVEDLEAPDRGRLARNYSRAGQSAYDNNDFAQARLALENVKKLAPNTPEAENADRLLANIKLAQGKVDLKGNEAKSAGKLVQKEIQGGNADLKQQQQKLLEEGLQAARAGNDQLAQTQLRVANDLANKLVLQGEDTKEQAALVREAQHELARINEKQADKAQKLREDLQKSKASGESEKALQLARQLQDLPLALAERQRLQADVDQLVVKSTKDRQARSEPNATFDPGASAAEIGRTPPSAPPPDDESRVFARQIEQARTNAEGEKAKRKGETLSQLRKALVELRDQGKYADAVDVAARLKKLDPTDQWAAEQYAVMSQFLLVMQDKRAHNDALREENRPIIDIRESGIPWYDLLNYPRDWPEITLRRQGDGPGKTTDGEADQALRRKMMQELPKLELNGIAFQDAVQFLRDVSGTNIYVKWSALQALGIDKTTPVNVKLQNVTFEKALKTILQDAGGANPLGYSLDDGVIRISTRADLSEQTVTKVYDVRDLITRRPNFTGPTIDLNSAGNNGGSGIWGNNAGSNAPDEDSPSRQELASNLKQLIESTVSGEGKGVGIREMGGMLIVNQTSENQRAVLDLLNNLREARGPAVSRGERLAAQNAYARPNFTGPSVELAQWNGQGNFINNTNSFLDDIQADFVLNGTPPSAGQIDPELKRFVERNYGWASSGDSGLSIAYSDGTYSANFEPVVSENSTAPRPRNARVATGSALDTDPLTGVKLAQWSTIRGSDTVANLAQRLRSNLEQKVVVNSTNINVPAAAAAGLGVQFAEGINGVKFAQADQAQVRTLMEQESRGTAGPDAVAANDRLQETIVGTDALLANGMRLNAAFAEDRSNTVDIGGNALGLPHDKYVLIDNGGYLTAVRMGPMQHWTEPPADVRFPDVPQEIQLPHVGRLEKFEKTLVKPGEQLSISLVRR